MHTLKKHEKYLKQKILVSLRTCILKVIHYCLQMCLKTLEISVIKYIYGLDPANFLTTPGLAWQACLKKTGVELDLLTDIDMLLMVENGI